jgi:hypothetical protein
MGELVAKTVGVLVNVLAIPLMVLNLLGGIVSGIWLAILGEWRLLIYGIVSFIGAGMLLGILLAPSLLFAAPAAMLLEKGKILLGMVVGFFSNIYLAALFTLWCGVVFFIFMRNANSSTFWPLLIWSYGVATAPIGFLASKERENQASQFTNCFVQVGYLLMMIAAIFFRVDIIDLMIVFGTVMILGLIFNWVVALAEMRYRYPS